MYRISHQACSLRPNKREAKANPSSVLAWLGSASSTHAGLLRPSLATPSARRGLARPASAVASVAPSSHSNRRLGHQMS
jgi:hypothetical protein